MILTTNIRMVLNSLNAGGNLQKKRDDLVWKCNSVKKRIGDQ